MSGIEVNNLDNATVCVKARNKVDAVAAKGAQYVDIIVAVCPQGLEAAVCGIGCMRTECCASKQGTAYVAIGKCAGHATVGVGDKQSHAVARQAVEFFERVEQRCLVRDYIFHIF